MAMPGRPAPARPAWAGGTPSWSDRNVKIRIGIGLGAAAAPNELAAAVSRLEELGIDSLWLSEMVYGPLVEPLTGMAYALARTARLKVGTGVSVLPGRHPVLVAKQLASLAGLAPARVLPVFGLQPARRAERALFPVPPGQRGAVFDESLELLRLLLRQQTVSFHGRYFSVDAASIGPLPEKPLDIWLGGSAPGGLRRVGRLGDGWLASFVTPDEARAGREVIQAAAAAAGREVDPEHFGISLPVTSGDIPAGLAESIHQRRPYAEPAGLVATSWPAARHMIEEYVAAGISKFVIRPATALQTTASFADDVARELMPLQT
jgi:probable F420-dependent oxidoreductase